MPKSYNQDCNIANTLDIIGDRWTLLILRDICFKGLTRFSDLKESLVGIAPNILSERLKLLEEKGILTTQMYSKHPPRQEYVLTESGMALEHILHAISMWGNRYLNDKFVEFIHLDCGTELTDRGYYCPTCDTHTKSVGYRMLPNNQHREDVEEDER